MKTGVIDVGGGLRGIFAAGVLDYCMDHDIDFDCGIGISAGAANICSLAAGQKGRNYQFYHDYSQRKEYMSVSNFLREGSYVDMDYVYSTLSDEDGENPLDYQAMMDSDMELLVVATNAHSGRPAYFDKDYFGQDDYAPLKASCAIPVACHPYKVKNLEYFDGGISDPIPLQKAFEMGCDKVVVILTKPEDYVRNPQDDFKYISVLQRKYPKAAKTFENRAFRYNTMVDLAKQLEETGKVLVIAPSNIAGLSTLSKDQERLDYLYRMGYSEGPKIKEFLLDA